VNFYAVSFCGLVVDTWLFSDGTVVIGCQTAFCQLPSWTFGLFRMLSVLPQPGRPWPGLRLFQLQSVGEEHGMSLRWIVPLAHLKHQIFALQSSSGVLPEMGTVVLPGHPTLAPQLLGWLLNSPEDDTLNTGRVEELARSGNCLPPAPQAMPQQLGGWKRQGSWLRLRRLQQQAIEQSVSSLIPRLRMTVAVSY